MRFEQGQTIYMLYRGVMEGTYTDKCGQVRSCVMDSPALVKRGTVTSVDNDGNIEFRASDIIDAFGNEKLNTVINPFGQEEPLGASEHSDVPVMSLMTKSWCYEDRDQAVAAMHRMNRNTIESWEGKTPRSESDQERVNQIKDLYADYDFANAVASIPVNDSGLEQ